MYRMSTTMVATTAWIICLAFIFSPVSAFVGARFGGSLQVGRWGYAQASTGSQLSMVATKRVENVAAVLLAGGVGKRMGADRPKQFLELQGMPVLEHSLKLFSSLQGISQLIVVMDEQYRETLSDFQQREPRLVFADPGKERQDSVYNGLQKVGVEASLVCIHDVARPLVTKECIYRVIADADEHGAAVLGVVMKATIKESEDGEFVVRTIDRSRLWEVQTPQVVKPDILRKGFEKGKENGWEVTDDVSIVEHLGLPVKLTKGEYTNLKLTTPEDLMVASQILETRRLEQADTLEVDVDDDAAGEERLSKTRANVKWAKNPRKLGMSEKEEMVSFSERRANVKWTDKPRGIAPPKEGEVDVKMDLSKIRAEA